jgi:hypothetical protein
MEPDPVLKEDVNAHLDTWLKEHEHLLPLSRAERAVWLSCWLDGVSYGIRRAQELVREQIPS